MTLRRRRRSPPSRPWRIVFLVHLVEAWDGIADVIAAMRAAPDFDPIVVSIPRRFNGENDLGFEEIVHQFLDAEDVEHARITVDDAERADAMVEVLAPDLVLRQSQWDDDVPPALATERLGFTRTALIPYETMNIVENVPQPGTADTALDSPYHRCAWIVFCANDLVLEAARRTGERRGAQFRVVGHPKADRLRRAAPTWPIPSPAGTDRTRIAWSAHHSIATNWTEFGTFPTVAPDMLHWATEEPDQDFVFLPHPALRPFTNRPESPITRRDYDAWCAAWNALPNTATSAPGRYAGVLAAADVVITDGLSMLVETQVVGRPLVFIERDGHRPFNEIGTIVMRGAHTAADVPAARKCATALVADGDPLAAAQKDNVRRLFGDDVSTTLIMTTLRKCLHSDPPVTPRD